MSIKHKIHTMAMAGALAMSATAALAVDEHYIDSAAVIGGYDVVSYHTAGAPTLGKPEYSAMYQGATWQFASSENLELFKADPAKYAPAHGGWCSAGASKGKKVPTQPDLWAVVDGQLYLNSSPKAHNDLFLANTAEVIRKGEANWKTIFATSREEWLAN
jgi:YHS domain-containing protein